MKRRNQRKRKSARTHRAVKRAPKVDALNALIEGGARALRLTIDPAWRANVKFNLHLVLDHAALVDEFPLADDTEPGPVFHA